ncbi:MAG: 1-acyl-sn-glycerol-3-phosphate acyltransferase [Ignavibacteriales bacterium]|nr:MAG: 1-acyl-sn-glycerol-3-phosphate acyltransferase [Ignavibacteriales bacterium]
MTTYIRIFFIVLFTIICSVFAIIFALADKSYRSYFWLSKIFSGGVLWISGIKLNVTGIENFQPEGTYILVSNHSSQFDIPAMQYAIPVRMSIVFKQELVKIPLFGWQLYLGPYVMINRKKADEAVKSIERAKFLMKEKKVSILLFAEGTRSRDGEIQPFKRGAFYLASRVGQPIIPVTISGAQKILPKGSLRINPGTLSIHFDKPIYTTGKESRQEELNLMQQVREVVLKNYQSVV